MNKKIQLISLQYKQPKFVYIAGPMVGYEDFNSKQFERIENILKKSGYEVVNPDFITKKLVAELGRHPTRQECLKADFHALTNCDAIFMLNGWSHSPGANKERQLALDCGMQIYYEEDYEF